MKKFLVLLLLLVLPQALFAAGTCSVTSERVRGNDHFTWTWTSDASGDVSGADCVSTAISGWIVHVITDPDDTAAPTDNYDIDFQDITDQDVCFSYLDNRDTANIERVSPLNAQGKAPYLANHTIELVVSAAGNAKSGTVIVIIYPTE